MSKRKHRRPMQTNRQGNILIIPDKRDIAREQEILAKPANAFYGTVVERMMDRLHQPDCTAQEAQNIGLVLQQLLRGDAALLNNMDDPAVAEQVAKIREQSAAIDRANAEWENNQEKFIDQVYGKADKIAPVGDKKTQAIASGMSQLREAQLKGKARWATQRMELQRRLETDPKIEVFVIPDKVQTTINGVVTMVEVKPTIKIMDRSFTLEVGRQYLPKVLAEHYSLHERTVQENEARRKVMAANMEATEYQSAMRQIDQDFGNPQNAQNMAAI